MTKKTLTGRTLEKDELQVSRARILDWPMPLVASQAPD